jgi:hypothetical protein
MDKTPGQIAYERYCSVTDPLTITLPVWGLLSEDVQQAWERAVKMLENIRRTGAV